MSATATTSLRGLRTFCIAARLQSFQEAGKVLFITASAVSHQIKSLEQELGVPLFERGGRELKLTATGQALYEDVGSLIEQLDGVISDYKNSGRRSTIRISVQPFFASEMFVPKLSEFTERHPHIDILVRTSDESEEKHPTDADLSIRLFKSPPKGLESTPLFPLRMAPTGSPDFKKSLQVKNKRIVSPFPLLVHESRPKAWKQWSQAAGIDLPADSKVTRLDSMIAVVRAVERGIGAALVPVPIADQWFRQGSIVRLFDDELVADTRYFLVSHPDSSELPEIRLLSDWIVDTFSIAA